MVRNKGLLLLACLYFASATVAHENSVRAAELRTSKHEQYARNLWKFVNDAEPWIYWTPGLAGLKPAYGPLMTPRSLAYVNAQGWTDPSAHGSLIVARHFATADRTGQPVSISIWYRVKQGYDATQDDWYWAHYLPNGKLLATSVGKNPYARRGFVAIPCEDRLWVFSQAAPQLAEFVSKGKVAKSVERASAGPDGKTLVAPDNETIDAYLAAEKVK